MGRPLGSVGNSMRLRTLPALDVETDRRRELEDLIRALEGGEGVSAASQITYDNATSGLGSTDVQEALDELSLRQQIVTVTGSTHTVSPGDYLHTVVHVTTAGGCDVTLPAALADYQRVTIKRAPAAGVVTILTPGSETIDGAVSKALAANGDSVVLYETGGDYFTMGVQAVRPHVYDQQINKFGRNEDVDTGAAEDVWSEGGLWPGPVTAGQASFVSDSADDDGDPGGTGARTLEMGYVDSNGDAQVESGIVLNGTTTVTSTATDVQWINSLRVDTAGSNGANVGTITAEVDSTDITNILPDEGRSLSTILLVPNAEVSGQVPYVLGWGAGIARKTSAQYAICELFRRTTGGANQAIDTAAPSSVGSSDIVVDFAAPIRAYAGEYYWIRVDEVSADGTRVGGRIAIVWL